MSGGHTTGTILAAKEREARQVAVRAEWVALSADVKAAEHGGSFRKYRQKALAGLLAASQQQRQVDSNAGA